MERTDGRDRVPHEVDSKVVRTIRPGGMQAGAVLDRIRFAFARRSVQEDEALADKHAIANPLTTAGDFDERAALVDRNGRHRAAVAEQPAGPGDQLRPVQQRAVVGGRAAGRCRPLRPR